MQTDTLKAQREIGANLIKQALAKYSATNKTVNSVEATSDDKSLQILVRPFIETLESGRGPRKSSTDGGFKDSMLEWMKARGVGANLSEKKRDQLAKFLVLKINREGDKLYKSGGNRDVYTSVLDKFTENLTEVVEKEKFSDMVDQVLESLKGIH
jgi:hypothetical protein